MTMCKGLKTLVLLTLIGSSAPLSAAQQTITASFLSVVERTESYLENNSLNIVDSAQTDRFALFYVTSETQAFTTISIYALPSQETRVTLKVKTDSPLDPNFDATLLDELSRIDD